MNLSNKISDDSPTHVRGRQFISYDQARKTAEGQREPWDSGVLWGGALLSSQVATTHFCAVGATGSGKTILLRLLMQTVLPLIGTAKQRLLDQEKKISEQPPASPEALPSEKPKSRIVDNLRIIWVTMHIIWIPMIFICDKMPKGNVTEIITGFTYLFCALPCLVFGLLWALCSTFKAYELETALIKFWFFYPPKQEEKPRPQVIEPPKPLPLPDVDSLHWEGHRALIYDAKQDIVSVLAGMRIPCPIYTLNPFDERCVAWDMAADITAPATALQVASILIPEDKNASQPFFSDAARHILAGVFQAFMKKSPGNWTFRDVVVAMKSKDRLCELLSAVSETQDIVSAYLDVRETPSIISTIATKMVPYEVVAAAWSISKEKISLRQWLKEESILILGNDESNRFALDSINRVIFKRLSELILAQSELSSEEQRVACRRTWIFIDEARETGDLEGLSSLLTKGRSKGACVVLGFQDIEGLRNAYGKERASEIVSMCANKAILRLESPETAEWASKVFGEYEQYEIEESWTEGESTTQGDSTTKGKGNNSGSFFSQVPTTNSKNTSETQNFSETENSSGTRSQKRVKREAVLASEFLSLPLTSPKHGLTGYFVSRSIGAYRAYIPGNILFDALIDADTNVSNFEHRPEAHQYLTVWDEADRERLGLGQCIAPIAAEKTTEILQVPEGLCWLPDTNHENGLRRL